LEALAVEDRAFYRVVYGLDPEWEDLQYIAGQTEKSHSEVLEQLQAIYQKNTRRQADSAKLMEKIAAAYSRLIELASAENALEEEWEALSHQRPMDGKQGEKVVKQLQQVRDRMARLRTLQEKWREESLKVLRIPSKDVAQVFGINPATVDKRVERIGNRVRKLLHRGREDDES
jgi:chromosome segregation ATPase